MRFVIWTCSFSYMFREYGAPGNIGLIGFVLLATLLIVMDIVEIMGRFKK